MGEMVDAISRTMWEHMRDDGHTWGNGIDNRESPTQEEIEESEALRNAYEERLKSLHRDSSDFAKEIKKAYKAIADICNIEKRRTLLASKEECLQKIGDYHNVVFDEKVNPYSDSLEQGKFAISYEIERSGQIFHPCVNNLGKEQLIEIAADMDEIARYTVFYKDFRDKLHFISNVKNAALQMEFEKWGIDEQPAHKRRKTR